MNVLTSSMVLLVGLLASIEAEHGESVQVIDHPHKNEYTSMVVGSDKHKYGYELKENKHFHHTTTEEDGVRLGCYGYVLDGKKYSTQYVADVRGYRPVSTHDFITVYPKSGGERQASFVGDFNEDKARSENIRYFFPDGCKGIEVKIPLSAMPPPLRSVIPVPSNQPNLIPSGSAVPPVSIITKPTVKEPPTSFFEPPFLPVESKPIELVKPTTKATPKPTTTQKPTPAPTKPTTKPTQPPTTSAATISAASTVPVTPEVVITTPRTTPRPTPPLLTKIPVPFNSLLRNPSTQNGKSTGSCSNSCCDDDDSAKLILPIPMKHLGQTEGSCEAYAKLIIPVEGLNPDSLRSLTRGPDATSELIKSVLQSLS